VQEQDSVERNRHAFESARLRRAGPEVAQELPSPGGGPSLAARWAGGGVRARGVPLDRETLREHRVILPEDTGPAGYAYRMLRTQLLRQAHADKLQLIGVVSAADGEGKTLTAINLALSLAAQPHHTALLVDLDLRKPGVAQLLWLGVEQGLEAWFEGSARLAELFVRFEGIERLRVLPTLLPVSGSSELLAATRTHALLQELKARYTDRLVIVDLPPVLLADDFLTLAPHLDGVLLVVSEGRTRREDVRRMKELLGGTRVLGTVLNFSGESEQRAY
jgi:protein-tyrosine kinase